MSSKVAGAAAIAILASTSTLHAHHSSSLFDFASPRWVRGAVVSYVPGNPHAMIALDMRDRRGEAERVSIEGPILARLGRMTLPAEFLQPGDVVEICAFPYRKEAAPDSPKATALHGHVIVLADRRMLPWSPYGKLDNCIRPSDTVETWAEFVNSEPMAREYWCNSRTAPRVASVAPPGFVDEINRRLSAPCR